jgi:uncharacterized membrane protein
MYFLLKLLHILAVMVFLGNILTSLFLHVRAAGSRDPKLLAHTMDGIIRRDRLFTLPGVVGIIVSGLLVASYGNLPIMRTGWILWSMMLFNVSGIIFMFRVAPLQRQLRALAEAGSQSDTFEDTRYHTLAVHWMFWGVLALLTPVAGVVLMVLKPNL